MFGLKGAYFYLVAIQISIIKLIKKIYFTSSQYNKSLKTKVPNQVHFNPNPYLLSIVSPYKKKLFKINDVSPNDFWLKNKNKDILDQHSFLWLNLIDRKTDGKNIQKIIYLWMLKYSSFKKKIWETSTLSSRIISWILNIDIIINNGTFDFKKNLFENIISQCNHLKRNIRFEKDPLKRIKVLTALLFWIAFKEYEENYNIGVKELENLLNIISIMTVPLTRSPNDLVYFSKYLILCHGPLISVFVPEFLNDIIRKNLICIKLLKTPDNQVPLFNGGSENDLSVFDEYLENIKLNQKEKNL